MGGFGKIGVEREKFRVFGASGAVDEAINGWKLILFVEVDRLKGYFGVNRDDLASFLDELHYFY